MIIIAAGVYLYLITLGFVSACAFLNQIKPKRGRGTKFAVSLVRDAGIAVAIGLFLLFIATFSEHEGDPKQTMQAVVTSLFATEH